MTDNAPCRVLIVDDEHLARQRIKHLIEKRDEVFDIQIAEDGISALEIIKTFDPQLVFLDIQMPELDGFDVINAIENPNFTVIFQTAFDEYAVKAFEVNACDYLLKPFSNDRFNQALSKALEAKQDDTGEATSALRDMRQIKVNVGQTSRIFDVDEINYFFSSDHATSIHMDEVNYSVEYSLNFLEERLNPEQFVRIHRNAIVNLSKIAFYTRGPQSEVGLHCGAKLKVSRERKRRLVASLDAGMS
jgi:two-component system LytT family response regulator